MQTTLERPASPVHARLPTWRAPTGAFVDAGRWQGRRLSPQLGLELQQLSLAQAFSDAEIAALRHLLCTHKVLVFRDQDLTPAQHVALARRFGELEVHPVISHHPEHPELVVFTHDGGNIGVENIFHSDTSFYRTPSMASMLRCVQCPEVGGDTIFVDMAAAYQGLPQPVKDRIDHLTAVHDASVVFGNRNPSVAGRAQLRRDMPPAEHPVVRTHPETGEKILYVNEAFTTHFANYRPVNDGIWCQDAPSQARELFAMLLRQARTPEYQVRIAWRKDTVVFWDNRAVQHYAISDYYPNVRSMMRATIVGDEPR
jgi:taurine dioxygenase